MKFGSFSDAIFHGATLRPQGFGGLFPGELSCAIGAGVEAIFEINDPRYGKQIRRLFPYLENAVHQCPEPQCQILNLARLDVGRMLAHLNDHHHWTRERIADWLRDEVEDKLGYVTITEESQVEVRGAGLSGLSEGAELSSMVPQRG